MNERCATMVNRFSELHVLVIGEAMLDTYSLGTSDRLCPEAPVPVVYVTERRNAPGGAANTAVNVRSLGAKVSFLSVIGDDAEGEELRHALHDCSVATELLVVEPSRRTLAKHRVLAASQILIRVDQGSILPTQPQQEQLLMDRLTDLFPQCHAIIVSDYGYGVLTPRVVARLAELQARQPRIIAADSKRLAAYRQVGLTAVKPNYAEAMWLLGSAALRDPLGEVTSRADQIAEYGERILSVTGSRIAAVTLDVDGAVTLEQGRPPYRTAGRPGPHSRAAGAGDTFLSGLTLALAAGAEATDAADVAHAAAAVVISKEGTATCSAAELSALLGRASSDDSGPPRLQSANKKVAMDLAILATYLESHRRQRRRIVFTNGCFDILHRGHVAYLDRAKSLGDLLVVGVNSDESIRRLKGTGRPINTLQDRLQVLAALQSIDYLIAFEEDTPHHLIRELRPDIFVKGGDYSRDRLPEAALVEELGGVVHILPFIPDCSTTRLIEQIERYAGNGRVMPNFANSDPKGRRGGELATANHTCPRLAEVLDGAETDGRGT